MSSSVGLELAFRCCSVLLSSQRVSLLDLALDIGHWLMACTLVWEKAKWKKNLKDFLSLLCVACRLRWNPTRGEGGEATWVTPAQWAAELGRAMGHARRVSKGTGGIPWPACGARWVVAFGPRSQPTDLLWGPFCPLNFLPSRSSLSLSVSVMRI